MIIYLTSTVVAGLNDAS